MKLGTRGFGVLVVGLLVSGCTSLQPLQGPTPEPGTRVAYDITDVGRVALGGSMGPEIAQVEGQLLGRDGEEFLLAVSGVSFLRGGFQTWSGEQIRLRPEYIRNGYERRASPGRSIALGAIAVGGFTAFLVGRSLGTSGQDPGDEPPPPAQERRVRP